MSDARVPALKTYQREKDWPASRIPERVEEWLAQLAGPSWIRIEGRDSSRCRIVSTLLHGNEPSGVIALHRWLRARSVPATDVAIFIGGVHTALAEPGFAFRVRPGDRDLNRCWLPPFDGEEGRLASEVLGLARSARPEALVDLHNNTGHNPAYGVGPSAGVAELALVSRFSRLFVHSDLVLGSLVEGTQGLCPSVTIECGRSGDPAAAEVAFDGLERFLAEGELALDSGRAPAVEILASPLRVGIRSGVRLAFGEQPASEADLTVVSDIDRHNFEQVPAGTHIGWVGAHDSWPLDAVGADGRDCSRDLFVIREGMLETSVPITPIMMTTNASNAKLDCLFYVVTPSEGG